MQAFKNGSNFWRARAVALGLLVAAVTPLSSQAQNIRQYDFGTGTVAEGYTQVTATNYYSDSAGFGFDYSSIPLAFNRRGLADPLQSDFATGLGPFFFSTKIPMGNYQVTVTLGDALKPSSTTIKAESRRLFIPEIHTRPGEFKTVSFNVGLRDSMITANRAVLINQREYQKLDWDNKLTIEFNGQRPVVNAITIQKIKDPIQVFLMGNSTVTDQSLEPWASWGQMLPAFFNSDRVVVHNMAASGETLRSALGRRRLEGVAAMLHKGDYVFIEFAHNDQKEGSGEKAYTTYNQYLKTYADTVRAHGAIPVFVTSTCRRSFGADGKLVNTLGDFPAAMRYEAKKEQITLLDLNLMTKTLYEAYGVERSKDLFVQFAPGTFAGVSRDLADNTHFCDFGAYELAKCMVELIKSSDLELKHQFRRDLKAFDPKHPDRIEDFELPLTPMFSQIKPLGS